MEDNKKPISEHDLEVLSIDTPEEYTPAPNEPQEPKRKRKKVLALAIGLALLAIAGAAAYFIFFYPKETGSQADAADETGTPQQSNSTTDYAREMIAKIRSAEEALIASFPQLKVEDSEATSPAYKYGSNAYYISGKFGSNITVTNTSTTGPQSSFSITTQNTATTILDSEDSLKRTSSDYSIKYTNEDLVCTVSVQTYPTFISCANVIDYAKLATKVSPFANALFANVGTEYRENTVIYEPSITMTSDNYARAIVSISGYEGVGGYAGLFYSADNAKNWVYWKGAQAEIPCEDYDTYALQKSFEGEPCYDESTETSKTVDVTLSI